MGQFAKDLEAGVDFFPCKGLQAFGAKTLHGKGSHHAAIEEPALQHLAVQLFLRGDVSHESAGERIARSGWIFDFLDGQSGRTAYLFSWISIGPRRRLAPIWTQLIRMCSLPLLASFRSSQLLSYLPSGESLSPELTLAGVLYACCAASHEMQHQ